jgi:hypothetical protein
MTQRRTLVGLGRFSAVELLAACVTPARAAIDMSGVYVAASTSTQKRLMTHVM